MTGDETFTNVHEFARALLTDRGPDDHGIGSKRATRVLLDADATLRALLWAALADAAEDHGIAPLLEPVISALAGQLPVPDEVRRAFVVLTSRHRRAAVAREACIDRLLRAFDDAGVPLILLKGAALAHRIYRDPALRPMADIDVLIDPADTAQAVSIANRLGYAFATRHGSRFSGRMHHLPMATMRRSGFQITLEIHRDTMSPNQAGSMTMRTLSAKPELFQRGGGPDGLTLGHTDMLRHLGHHAFEPARRVRLIHLYDLWRYQTVFHDKIDWRMIEARFPEVITILRLVGCVFARPRPGDGSSASGPVPAGVGLGMAPLSEIAADNTGLVAKLAAVFNPPAWWLHGFYGIPPERSLAACRTVRHPVTVLRWLAKRLVAGITTPGPRWPA